MNKTTILMVLALVLLAGLASAQEEMTHDGWHFSEESVTIHNIVFFMDLDFSATKLILKFNDNIDYVNLGSCKTLDATNDVIKVCYADSEWDLDKKMLKYHVQFYTRFPDITVTRSIDSTDLLVGEETEIRVVVKNTGVYTANNITYIDYFPEGIEITDTDGIKALDNATVWEGGHLNPGQEKEFSYIIKPNKAIEMELKAFISYFDGMEVQKIYSSAVKLKTHDFVSLKTVLKDSILTGEETNLTVNMTNRGGEEIEVEYLEVVFPKSIEVLKAPILMKEVKPNVFRWVGELDVNHSKRFKFDIRGTLIGSSSVFVNTQFVKDDSRYVISRHKEDIKVEDRGIAIRTDLEDGFEVESYQEKAIRIWVQNLNPYVKIKDVKIKMESGAMFLGDVFLSWMNETEQKKVGDFKYIGPDISSGQSYKIKVSVDYKTQYGDHGSEDKEYSISLSPVQSLVITQDSDLSEIEEDEETYVRVSVKNNRNVDAKDVHIKDTVDPRLSKLGLSETTVNINPGDDQQIYSYKIRAPSVKSTETFCINTTAQYKDESGNYTYIKQRCIKVKPRAISLSVSKSVNEAEVFRGQVISTKYTITNTESDLGDTAKNVTVMFPLGEYYDIMDRYSYSVDELEPGESVTIDGEEQIRLKFNTTSLTIDPTSIYFNDKEGNPFIVNSSAITVDSKYGNLVGAAVFLNKTIEHATVNATYGFEVRVAVENIGDEMAKDIVITDEGNRWEILSMPPKAKKVYTYKRSIDDVGKFRLTRAVADYPCMERSCRTASNELTVTVLNATVEQQVAEEKARVEREIAEQATKESEEARRSEPKKNPFAIIADFFVKLFSYKRGGA